MANPLVIEIDAETVTPIATNVTAGSIRNLERMMPILCTTRRSGEEAPSADDLFSEGVPLFAADSVNEEIASSVAIDIYVYATADTRIRVDLP